MNLIPSRRSQSGFWFDPFRELERIQSDMNSLFNWSITDPTERQKEGSHVSYSMSPSLDYDEDEKNVMVKVDLPGIDKKDISVSVQEGVLTIKGERKEEQKSKSNGAKLTERYHGRFYRQISLPTSVDDTKVSAEYKDGVLNLTLPKKEEAKPKQIKVDIR